MADPYAHLKENAWREAEALDAALERGEIGEEEWHRRWQEIVVPAYLGAETPWGQSGKTGTAEDWEWSRSHVADAIDRDGSFLDVGCANGYLMECLPRWTAFRVEPYGLEISSDLAELAPLAAAGLGRADLRRERADLGGAARVRRRADGNRLRPGARRQELVERLLGYAGRLVIGVFNEHSSERTTEEALESWGFTVSGRSVRPNRWKPGMEYRVFWIDR